MTSPTRPEPPDIGASDSRPVATPAPSRLARRRRLRRVAMWLSGGALLAGVLAAITGLLLVRHFSEGLPSVEYLRGGYNPPQVSRVLAADGTLLFSEFIQRRTVVPFSDVPDVTKLAFLAAEDAYFYEHGGIRFLSLARALRANIRAGGRKVQGGSTITQQVAEDVLLGHSRALSQKMREWILAYRLERELSKDEILGLYLNNIFLGHGRYGVDEAARFYFGKRAARLDAAESALLAGIIANPGRYSPRTAPELALKRRGYVLRQMRAKHFIEPELYDRLIDAPLVLAPVVEAQHSLAPEVVQPARQLLARVREEQQSRGGYDVETSIDPRLQSAARQAVSSALDAYAERQKLRVPFTATRIKAWGKPFSGTPRPHRIYVGVVHSTDDATGSVLVQVGDVLGQVRLSDEGRYNPAQAPASEFTRPGALLRVRMLEKPTADHPPRLRLEIGPQAALAAIDVRTRRVVALVGSQEGTLGGFDRSTQAHRQPGSAFKPLVYSSALHEHEVSLASVLSLDRKGPGIISDGPPPYAISVRSALAHSNNDAAVALLNLAGPAKVVAWATELGIRSPLRPDNSLALGAYEVTPLELANAYATFASGGLQQEPSMLVALRDQSGRPLPLPEVAPSRRVMPVEEAYLVTSLLQTVVESGTAEQAKSLGRPIAAKTGTTNEVKDAWFVGYSTELSVAVWVGYDDTLPLGPKESGTRTAGPAFVQFMQAAHLGRPVSEFPRPAGIVTVSVDPATGLRSWAGQTNALREEFLDGTAPEQKAPEPTAANLAAGADPAAVVLHPPAP
jgi:penicillin-binding protein 1A